MSRFEIPFDEWKRRVSVRNLEVMHDHEAMGDAIEAVEDRVNELEARAGRASGRAAATEDRVKALEKDARELRERVERYDCRGYDMRAETDAKVHALTTRLSALEGKAAETGKGRVPGWYPVNIPGYIAPALRFWSGIAWLYRQGSAHTLEYDRDFSWIGPRIDIPEGGR